MSKTSLRTELFYGGGGRRSRAAATTRLNGKQGTELADVIVNKIKQAVNAITYR